MLIFIFSGFAYFLSKTGDYNSNSHAIILLLLLYCRSNITLVEKYDYTYIRNAIDFVTRSWIKSPVETREDWAKMRVRYCSGDSGRVTSLSEAKIIQINQRDSYLNLPINGSFWQLREWMGFETLCIAMAEDAPFVEEMIAFWQDFVLQVLRKADIKKVNFDSVLIQEDMAYKAHSMISPAVACRSNIQDGYERMVIKNGQNN